MCKSSEKRVGKGEIGEMFGPHLMLDLYGCDRKKLEDINFIYKFLDELPSTIGMTKIMPPYTFSYTGTKPEDWGISGIVLIAESHVSIHTFPEKEYASVDVFSCKEFDTDATAALIAQAFGAKKVEKNFLMRGREFPKDITRAAQIVARQRKRI
ncbi:MAG: adenosylmethionine decarboxylase [Candidatus Micrarchaeia archaeon]